MKVGDRVSVNMVAVVLENTWLQPMLKRGVPQMLKGTVRRIADNGKIGIEFDNAILRPGELIDNNTAGPYNLHGKGRKGRSLYVHKDAIINRDAIVEVRPQGEIAQMMEDTMLDQEYGMSDEEYDDIIGF